MTQVNNNRDVSKANGGSHWSLLVYTRGRENEHVRSSKGRADVFAHFDSAGGINRGAADALAHAVAPWLGSPGARAAAETVNHAPAAAPRQTNGYDCGLYVLAAADAVCAQHAENSVEHNTLDSNDSLTCSRSSLVQEGGGSGQTMTLEQRMDDITPKFIADFRYGLLELIERVSAETEGSDDDDGAAW